MRKSTIAIVSLLMLSIPFQGFAAAIQSGCALGHHRAAWHQHGGHDDHAAMHVPAVQADADSDSDSGATECKCSTCGLGTGLPVSQTDTIFTPPAAAPLGRFIYPPIVMITGSLERPPRNILA